MYVAVKGGEAAISNAHQLLAEDRRGDTTVPELSVAQIREQLSGSVDRVMTEGSVYDPDLAALALKQARGDQVEAKQPDQAPVEAADDQQQQGDLVENRHLRTPELGKEVAGRALGRGGRRGRRHMGRDTASVT